jgi:endonuclease VIII
MPEGDNIFRAARTLQKALGGKIVTGFETALAPLARVNDDAPIVGRTVERVESRGKWCLMFFSGDLILVTHMRMSGSWHIYRTGEKWQVGRNHMRLAITCGEFQAVAFDVPIVELHTARSLVRHAEIALLGPDVLGADFTVEKGRETLRSWAAGHPEDEVGNALLNQRVLAGLGNVYKSEVAFAAGVHPFRRLSTLTPGEVQSLVDFAGRYLRENVRADANGGRRTRHSMDREERLWVYSRHGQECRRCGALIMKRRQGRGARSTWWCPSCQPWVPAAGQSVEPPQGKPTVPARRREPAGHE